MIPSPFDYVAPSTLDEAIAVLGEHDGEAKILSGGQSLIPMLKLRLAAPTVLVDINRIPGLNYVEERDGGVYVECESVSLTRDIPFGLGWAVGPFVTSLPRESLELTLTKTRETLMR